MPHRNNQPHRVPRRSFLVASGLGVAGLSFGQPTLAGPVASEKATAGTAKSTILFFLSGGASHLDMWDLKPNAPQEYRGQFQPIATSAAAPMIQHAAEHIMERVNLASGSKSCRCKASSNAPMAWRC